MVSPLRTLGGVASAVLSIGAVVVVIVKWAQSSSDEIVPILLSGAALSASFVLVFGGLGLLAVGFVQKDRTDRTWWVLTIVLGTGLLAFAVPNQAVRTVLHGRYYDGNSDVIVPLGLIGMLALGTGFVSLGVDYLQERKQAGWAPRGKQLCPDCAEYPKEKAKVCRYCGHRFEQRSHPKN